MESQHSKSCHSFETIIAMNGHSARRGCQHHHLFVPGHYLLCQHEEGNYSLLRHKKKRFPYKKMSLRIKLKIQFIEPSFRYTPANHKFAVRQS